MYIKMDFQKEHEFKHKEKKKRTIQMSRHSVAWLLFISNYSTAHAPHILQFYILYMI